MDSCTPRAYIWHLYAWCIITIDEGISRLQGEALVPSEFDHFSLPFDLHWLPHG
jgi:hypothetical protein